MLINKSRMPLPSYLAGAFRGLCRVAGLKSASVPVILKRRNRYESNRYERGEGNAPNGAYFRETRTIIIRTVPNANKDDLLFVLAHEIGHFKQHKEHPGQIMPTRKSEDYANRFALQVCHCSPKADYPIKKRIKEGATK